MQIYFALFTLDCSHLWVLLPAWVSIPRPPGSGRWRDGRPGTCSVGWSRPPVRSLPGTPRFHPPSRLGNRTSLCQCVRGFPVSTILTIIFSIMKWFQKYLFTLQTYCIGIPNRRKLNQFSFTCKGTPRGCKLPPYSHAFGVHCIRFSCRVTVNSLVYREIKYK